MSCDKTPGDCRPCQDCQDVVAPIEPRCNVVLADGVFPNATAYVNNGCLVKIEAGEPLLYSPDACCSAPGGGGSGGGEGKQGPKGDPGQNASITIGQVTSVSPGSPAEVINTGTPTNAVLEFRIPRGAKGDSASIANGLNYAANGVKIENGFMIEVPVGFPGPSVIMGSQNLTMGYEVKVDTDDASGIVTISLDISTYNTNLWNSINTALNQRDTQIANLQNGLNTANSNITDLQNRVAKLEKKVNP